MLLLLLEMMMLKTGFVQIGSCAAVRRRVEIVVVQRRHSIVAVVNVFDLFHDFGPGVARRCAVEIRRRASHASANSAVEVAVAVVDVVGDAGCVGVAGRGRESIERHPVRVCRGSLLVKAAVDVACNGVVISVEWTRAIAGRCCCCCCAC